MKLKLTDFSLKRPWLVLAMVTALTAVLAAQFPKVTFDNDPENMLSKDEHVRMFHHRVKQKFNLYDFVIVGVVNEEHADGVFNVGTLGRIHDLTAQLLQLRRTEEGLPSTVRSAAQPDERLVLDLTPDSGWRRGLNVAFRHDPNGLFDQEGSSAIIGRELISPSVVDSIQQAEFGSLKIEYLMERPPSTREEALAIRDNAMSNPLYRGTLVSEDEKAICVYIPITEKTFSYNVASLVKALTHDWPTEDKVFITGLPVAEDTFGVEMLVQMATSAPLAGLAIFVLLLIFFRRLSLIIAPMIVAIVSVVCTMGLLIGLGFDVHIMSSMIAIFLMPIAVADSVHILSEFFDVYSRFETKRDAVRHVIGHLFTPMLYTSLTTMAGFASLGLTPIPPVRVFGLHVAFGVGLAWVLTMTLIPAYIMLFVSDRALSKVVPAHEKGPGELPTARKGTLAGGLEWLGGVSYRYWQIVLAVTILVMGLSVYGISKIRVNDNPVKWFTSSHPIRVADEVLNAHFGGTYTAYLTLEAARTEGSTCAEKAQAIGEEARRRFGKVMPEATDEFLAILESHKQLYFNVASSDLRKCFLSLVNAATEIDERAFASWNALADEVNYLEADGLTHETLLRTIGAVEAATDRDRKILITRLQGARRLAGLELLEYALEVCDEFTALSFREFAFEMQAELTAPLFKQPVVLRYVEALQQHLAANVVVGKSSSAVDALKKAAYELSYVAPPADAEDDERNGYDKRNRNHFAVPGTVSAVAQVFTQLEGMKKKDSLFHLVTKDYQEANVWVQLKSGDNRDMEAVVRDVSAYMRSNPPPVDLNVGWAGLTYLNVVWQDKMVKGMMSSLISSFVVVLVMMAVLFRSPIYGILSMIPLTVTIAFIYGMIGFVGKDYDMPVAVLSALTLGLSVDFSIHFLQRARELQKQTGSWQEASRQMFQEPAMAISRNAIIISIGFTPLLLAPLVPYRTVGFFLATIMAVSWAATLLILPALITALQRFLFRSTNNVTEETQ
jgi:predicted RND superfamily exporter protein